MPSANEITHMMQNGEMDYSELKQMIEICLDGCSKTYQLMKKSLLLSAQKLHQN
jgi:ribonuclease PH